MIIDLNDVRVRWKKKNKLLFSRDSLCLQELAKLVALEEHKTVVLWALDCAKLPLKEIETRYPGEHRPRRCLELCEAWAKGQIRMPVTRSAILDLHALAREIREERYSLLCRAIAHAGATVHTKKHAMGLPIYELTALVLKYGIENFEDPVGEKIDYYLGRLTYWQKDAERLDTTWTRFLK